MRSEPAALGARRRRPGKGVRGLSLPTGRGDGPQHRTHGGHKQPAGRRLGAAAAGSDLFLACLSIWNGSGLGGNQGRGRGEGDGPCEFLK